MLKHRKQTDINSFYLPISLANHLDIPIGDKDGLGASNMPFIVGPSLAIGASVAAAVEAVATIATIAGLAMSIAGMATGDKELTKIGGIVGLAGGVTSLGMNGLSSALSLGTEAVSASTAAIPAANAGAAEAGAAGGLTGASGTAMTSGAEAAITPSGMTFAGQASGGTGMLGSTAGSGASSLSQVGMQGMDLGAAGSMGAANAITPAFESANSLNLANSANLAQSSNLTNNVNLLDNSVGLSSNNVGDIGNIGNVGNDVGKDVGNLSSGSGSTTLGGNSGTDTLGTSTSTGDNVGLGSKSLNPKTSSFGNDLLSGYKGASANLGDTAATGATITEEPQGFLDKVMGYIKTDGTKPESKYFGMSKGEAMLLGGQAMVGMAQSRAMDKKTAVEQQNNLFEQAKYNQGYQNINTPGKVGWSVKSAPVLTPEMINQQRIAEANRIRQQSAALNGKY